MILTISLSAQEKDDRSSHHVTATPHPGSA
jgi:hypothetical protein